MVSCSGSLVQSCCGEGRRCRQTSLCVGSAPRVPATLVCPAQGCLCFPRPHCSGSRPLYMEGGPPQKRGLGWACPARAAQAARSLTGALSPGAARLLPSAAPAAVSTRASRVRAPCVYSRELASSRDPPGGCRPSRISGSLLLETGGLSAVW